MKQTILEVTQSYRSPNEAVRRVLVQEKIDQYIKRRMEAV